MLNWDQGVLRRFVRLMYSSTDFELKNNNSSNVLSSYMGNNSFDPIDTEYGL